MTGEPHVLSAVEAGSVLGLPPDVVRALADAGYLRMAEPKGGSPRFALDEVKAFQARAVDGSSLDEGWDPQVDDLDAEELVEALEARADEMADRAIALLTTVFPEAAQDPHRLDRYRTEARDRIGAVITLCARGPGGAEAIERDLADAGATAARAGVPLAQLLLALRMSRDLVLQTAIEVAEERGRHWGLAVGVVLTRALPAIDRLADAITTGYWESRL